MEVATVASNLDEQYQDSYRQFRQAHIDKFSLIGVAIATIFGAIVIVVLAVGVAFL
ncbi:hypothetical protein D3C83_111710 [compost metagenome]